MKKVKMEDKYNSCMYVALRYHNKNHPHTLLEHMNPYRLFKYNKKKLKTKKHLRLRARKYNEKEEKKIQELHYEQINK